MRYKISFILCVLYCSAILNAGCPGTNYDDGGLENDISFDLICNPDNADPILSFMVHGETDDVFRIYHTGSTYIFNAEEIIELDLIAGERHEMILFKGAERVRIFSGMDIDCERPLVLVSEYFSCNESTTQSYDMSWRYDLESSEDFESMLLNGTNVGNLSLEFGHWIAVSGFYEGMSPEYFGELESSGEELVHFINEQSNECCPCRWDNMDLLEMSLTLDGDMVLPTDNSTEDGTYFLFTDALLTSEGIAISDLTIEEIEEMASENELYISKEHGEGSCLKFTSPQLFELGDILQEDTSPSFVATPDVSISPNPLGASKIIHVDSENLIVHYEIYNHNGSRISGDDRSSKEKQFTISLAEISEGLYYLLTIDAVGNRRTEAIVVR